MDKHARGARSGGERQRGTSARLAVLVAALVLVLASCGLADPVTKSRTDSMRGPAWPGADADQTAHGSVAVVHTGTPSPEPTASAASFYGAFQSSADHEEEPAGEVFGPVPDRVFWPLAPSPDEPNYEELDHTPEPDADFDPCDATGVLPDECDPAPEPTPCDESAAGCDPGDCEETDSDGCTPPDCKPTSEPTESSGSASTQTPKPSSSPDSTQSPEPTTSPSPTDPPDDGEPGC